MKINGIEFDDYKLSRFEMINMVKSRGQDAITLPDYFNTSDVKTFQEFLIPLIAFNNGRRLKAPRNLTYNEMARLILLLDYLRCSIPMDLILKYLRNKLDDPFRSRTSNDKNYSLRLRLATEMHKICGNVVLDLKTNENYVIGQSIQQNNIL